MGLSHCEWLLGLQVLRDGWRKIDELIDIFALSDWPGKEMDRSIDSAFSLRTLELIVQSQVFRVLWQVTVTISCPHALEFYLGLSSTQGSRWLPPWKPHDCQKQGWHKGCLWHLTCYPLPPALKKHVSHTLVFGKVNVFKMHSTQSYMSVSFPFTRWKKRSILRQLLPKGAQGLALFTECF